MIKSVLVIMLFALIASFSVFAGNEIYQQEKDNMLFIIDNSRHNKEETYINMQDVSDTALCVNSGMLLQAVGAGKQADEAIVDNLVGAIELRSEMQQMLIGADECTEAVKLGIKEMANENPAIHQDIIHHLSALQNKEKVLEKIQHAQPRITFFERYAGQH